MSDILARLRTELADRYQIEREIGRGGMAAVYVAQDRRYGRTVAIKVLHPEVATVIGPERFQREIQVTAQLTHPGILPVLDSGESPGPMGPLLWYAMPFIEGQSLRDRITRERQLSVDDAVAITREVAESLDYAHRRGIVHRDVKPENILLQDGRPLLADFGIARAIDPAAGQRLTESGLTLGTPAYMSPEQALAEPVDARSDVYALGCVLYEALTGEPPFTGPTAQAILGRMLADVPRAITPVRPQAAALEPLVMKALARLPADRYQTARELATALGQPRTPLPAPGAERPRPPQSRRFRRLAVGAVVTLGAVVAAWRFRPRAASSDEHTARIVVLPFRNIGDSARIYFTSGMTAALRAKLATIPGIEVIAAGSTEAADLSDPAQAARSLGAGYALSGTVAWDSSGGGRLRVQPRLIAAKDGGVLLSWPSPLEALTRDVFTLERDLTEAIAGALKITIGGTVRSRLGTRASLNPAAYELLLQAEAAPTQEQTRELTLRAVALDSNLAVAWSRIGQSATMEYRNTGVPMLRATARDGAERGARLAPDLAEAQFGLGLYHRIVTRNYDSALAHLRRAQQLAPGESRIASFLASVYLEAGRLDEAIGAARRSAGLDPLNPGGTARVVRILVWQRKPAEAWTSHLLIRDFPAELVLSAAYSDGALAQMQSAGVAAARGAVTTLPVPARPRAVRFLFQDVLLPQAVDDSILAGLCGSPNDPGMARARAARLLMCAEAARRAGRIGASHAAADSALPLVQALVQDGAESGGRLEMLAYALLLSGQRDAALTAADSGTVLAPIQNNAMIGAWVLMDAAFIAALAGDADRAIPMLDTLLTRPSPITATWLRSDPTFDLIRNDPRFKALLNRP